MEMPQFDELFRATIPNYLAGILTIITVCLSNKIWELLKSFFTNHKPREYGRRELLAIITASWSAAFVLFGMTFISLFVKRAIPAEQNWIVACVFITEGIVVGSIACWAITKTPIEKQSASLRYGAIFAIAVASISLSAFGYFEYGCPNDIFFVNKIAVIVILALLLIAALASAVTIRHNLATKQVRPYNIIDLIIYSLLSGLFFSMSAIILIHWQTQFPEPPMSPWFLFLLKYFWPIGLVIPLIIWGNSRASKGTAKACGYTSAVLATFLIFIAGILGPRMNFQRAAPDIVIKEAESHPNHVIIEADGEYRTIDDVPIEAVIGFWKSDENGKLKGVFLPNSKYHPHDKQSDQSRTTVYSFPSKDQ